MVSGLRFASAAAVAASAAMSALAPIASAAPSDAFLDELGWDNVALPGVNPADTVAAGYHTCDELRQGTSVLDEMSAVESTYKLPMGQGTLFVSAATTNLCPDFAG
ncbi:DUF732 domain-containing protein [Mycolicibacterium moriokaense]|nr:DUF732 domain-containing protein [Mycolicibacterium moriokaense]